jgi:hypothetical protein
LLPDDRCRRAVEVNERCADGLVSGAEQDAALVDGEATEAARIGPARAAARAVASAWSTAEHARSAAALASPDPIEGRRHQPGLLRDLTGNPCHPVPVELAWLEHDRGKVAQIDCTIYDEHRFADLPSLADALK